MQRKKPKPHLLTQLSSRSIKGPAQPTQTESTTHLVSEEEKRGGELLVPEPGLLPGTSEVLPGRRNDRDLHHSLSQFSLSLSLS